jgi:hypothetical protein
VGRLQTLEWASQWDRVRFAVENGRHVTRRLEGTSASPDSVMISLEPRASAARYIFPQPSQLPYLPGPAAIRSRSSGPCRGRSDRGFARTAGPRALGRRVLRCRKAFTNHFREICVTLASVRPRAPRRRPDDRARQPYGASASACR